MKIRNITLGEDIPKICVPIVEVNQVDILKEAKTIISSPADLIEWRVDFYEDCFEEVKLKDTIRQLRDIIKDTPLLFTFRTFNEGGNKKIENEDYVLLNKWAIETTLVDLVDIEIMLTDKVINEIISYAHKNQVKIIASNHDFNQTPNINELTERFERMYQFNADILKVAVMPKNSDDVLSLLRLTNDMKQKYSNHPIITMSMSGLGLITRLSGELFGSALTFASLSKASAPGQINVYELKDILNLFHQHL